MNKIIAFFLFGLLLASCSSDDDNNNDDGFFNLNTGNLRVYKRFHSADGVNFTPSDRIDSVRTTGDTVIGGVTYEKFQHRTYSADNFLGTKTEALRVNQAGHLVNEMGFVLHPGYDMEYTDVRQYFVAEEHVGNINYYLQAPVSVALDGQPFYVYPYRGDYVPLDPGATQQYVFDMYQPGIGLFTQHCSTILDASSYEDRLIAYDVN